MSKVREKEKLLMFLPVNAGATAMMVRRIARPIPHAVHPTRIELRTLEKWVSSSDVETMSARRGDRFVIRLKETNQYVGFLPV
jgi:hypothetical protein